MPDMFPFGSGWWGVSTTRKAMPLSSDVRLLSTCHFDVTDTIAWRSSVIVPLPVAKQVQTTVVNPGTPALSLCTVGWKSSLLLCLHGFASPLLHRLESTLNGDLSPAA